jgi:trimeric autotransporter adhesin
MTTITQNVGGALTATAITASTGFIGDGSQLTNLPTVTLGAANAVVITNGSSQLTTETTLSPVRGGTGGNSSAATGIPHVTAGTWSYSGITSSDLAVGFTVTNAQTTATSANTASAIVARDGSGNFSAGAITSTSLVQTATTVTPNGTTTARSANVQTTNSTATAIVSLTTTNSSVFAMRVIIACINTTDAAPNTGMISYLVKAATSAGGAVTISGLANYSAILDTNVSAVTSTVTSSGSNNLTVNVTGIAAKTIDWLARVETLSQA